MHLLNDQANAMTANHQTPGDIGEVRQLKAPFPVHGGKRNKEIAE
ncbi:hypothetical protein [Pseudovibrio sp. Ad26]|nr:hypothetical protein [Pseudovibrio sp. Ad26]